MINFHVCLFVILERLHWCGSWRLRSYTSSYPALLLQNMPEDILLSDTLTPQVGVSALMSLTKFYSYSRHEPLGRKWSLRWWVHQLMTSSNSKIWPFLNRSSFHPCCTGTSSEFTTHIGEIFMNDLNRTITYKPSSLQNCAWHLYSEMLALTNWTQYSLC